MRGIAVVLCIWLGACANSGLATGSQVKLPVLSKTSLTAEQVKAVQTAMRGNLKDPDSAKFGDIIAGTDPANPSDNLACGYVNSKNSYGGYTGAQVFMAKLNQDGTAKFIGMDIAGICEMQGLSMAGLRAS